MPPRAEPGLLTSGGLVSPAADRNKGPILEVLQRELPETGLVLEVASGAGQHLVHFARALTGLTWQPSDPDADARQSIAAWLAAEQLSNVRPALDLDVRKTPWPVQAADAIVCINMIHISPWAASLALFAGAKATLRDEGLLYLYGPYAIGGRHTAPSNASFDASLRARNPEWGVRDLDCVMATAAGEGFAFIASIAMPANNLSVIFRKRHAVVA